MRSGDGEKGGGPVSRSENAPAGGKLPAGWRVQLPASAPAELKVFVNGVPQQAGRDYRREGSELVFERPLAREGRLGFWRWLSLFLGVAGTYRQDDSVDVVYDTGGRREIVTGLDIRPPD